MATVVGADDQFIYLDDNTGAIKKIALAAAGISSFNQLANQPVIYAQVYGVKADTRWTNDGVIHSGSPTVTSATINFSQADVGKVIYTVNVSTGLCKLIGTVLSVQSGTSCTASANASATESGDALCIGTDDTISLQTANTAALAAGATLYLPSGAMLVSAQPFYMTGTNPAGSYSVEGQGEGTVIVLSPNFNFGAVQGNGIIYDAAQVNALPPDDLHTSASRCGRFNITALCHSFPSGPSTGISLIALAAIGVAYDMQMAGIFGPANLSCLLMTTECRCYNMNIQPQFNQGAVGQVHCISLVNGATHIDIHSPVLAYTNGWGINFLNNDNCNVFGGIVVGTGAAPGQDPHASVSLRGSTNIRFYGIRINGGPTGGATPANLFVDGTSEAELVGALFENGTTGSNGLWVASGGVVRALNFNNAVTGSAAGVNNSGTIYDLGGNVLGSVSGSGTILQASNNTTAASASAGSNGDVPNQVVGYKLELLNGTMVKIPYYAV